MQKAIRTTGNFVHSGSKRCLVHLGGFAKTANFPHELERSILNFLGGYRRIKVKERFYISTHFTYDLNGHGPELPF